MFKPNTSHLQGNLFPIEMKLSERQRKNLLESGEYYFYQTIYSNINESDFAVLYSDLPSRPNAPVNSMVSALILMTRKKWTYEELFDHIQFDLKTRMALGLNELNEIPFCEASLFNFQNHILWYHVVTGINLLEEVFDKLTAEQIKNLKLKTDIQRTDSTQAASNIRGYGRLQLLIEVLLRVWRVFTAEEKKQFEPLFAGYMGKTSGQYIYRIETKEIKREINEIAKIYQKIRLYLKKHYGSQEIYQIFQRVYTEHFTVFHKKIRVKDSSELGSWCLQSPDDMDATYRKKGKKESRGQVINVVETCHPENELNLITDVSIAKNNVDDSTILNERLDIIKEKTPELAELHTDGGYGSQGNDQKIKEMGITQVQTAIKGRGAGVEMNIEKTDKGKFKISCPHQTVEAVQTQKRMKVIFRKGICRKCKLKAECGTIILKKGQVYYFTEKEYLMKQRQKSILWIPQERRGLRANIEATMKEFKRLMEQGKLKVRGAFKSAIFAYSAAIAINFGRIYRKERLSAAMFFYFFIINMKNIFNFLKKLFLVNFCRQKTIKKLLWGF